MFALMVRKQHSIINARVLLSLLDISLILIITIWTYKVGFWGFGEIGRAHV